MLENVIELLGAPALVAIATLAGRRWGARTGGAVSAFPAIVGPVLVVVALAHGSRFAAQAANGVLLGLGSLSAFALVYARLSPARGWGPALAAGWAAAGLAALAVDLPGTALGPPAGLLVASISLIAAHRLIAVRSATVSPARPQTASPARRRTASSASASPAPSWRRDLAARTATAAALVIALAAAAGRLGPLAGGVLAGLPVLASVLAVFTHRRDGGFQTATLLRGMLAGMSSFVIFCEVVALLVVPSGIATAFTVATLAALSLQAVAAGLPARRFVARA